MTEPLLLLPAYSQTTVDETLARIDLTVLHLERVAEELQAWVEAITPALKQLMDAMQTVVYCYWRAVERSGCRAFPMVARLVWYVRRREARLLRRLLDWRIAQMGET